MADQVIRDAARVAARQEFLARNPVSPMVPQDRLFLFLRAAIVQIRLSQRQLERLFVMFQNQGTSYEPHLDTHRTESLVVEIVGYALRADLIECLQRGRSF